MTPFGLQRAVPVPADSLPEGAAYSPAAQVTMAGEVALVQNHAVLSRSGSSWGESTQGQKDECAW